MPAGAAAGTIEVRDIAIRFGGLQALDGVSLMLRRGEVTALIGPNGAGKSTFVNCLTGLVAMDRGEIMLEGVPARAPLLPRLIDLGIARTFQSIRLFPSLTVREQVRIAQLGLLGSARRHLARKNQAPASREALLGRLGLDRKAGLFPFELSYGERRRLEIARALATEPVLLFLDEPAAGMVPSEQMALGQTILEIARTGVAVLLIEHHMDLVASVASEVVVLNFGRRIASGTIDSIRSNKEVISAYLGSTGLP